MKWFKEIKTNTRLWLANLSGLAPNAAVETDETAIINAYFESYLQNMAADHLSQKYNESYETNIKHPEKPLRVLSPLKQVL